LLFPKQYLSAVDGGPTIGRWIARRPYSAADHIVAISDATKSDLIREFEINPNQVSRVYNGVDIAAWERATPESALRAVDRFGLSPQGYLLYVGDVDWRKNVEGMVLGLAWAKKHGTVLTLALAGLLSDEKHKRLMSLAKAAGVEDLVRCLGFVGDDDLLALYRGSVAHLFVSRAEGFGLTVVEAMAAGCPVITTRKTSLEEVAGNAAALVDPEREEEIGQAIVQLATNQQERTRLIALGVEQAKRFPVRAQAQGMVDVWHDLLVRRGVIREAPGPSMD